MDFSLTRRAPAELSPLFASRSLSVVLPVQNVAQSIAQTIREMVRVVAGWGIDCEIIAVNDGSTDGTRRILKRLAAEYPLLRIINLPQPRGCDAALAVGLRAAHKASIFWMACDGQFDIRDLASCLPLLDRYDIVLGYRENSPTERLVQVKRWGARQWHRLVLGAPLTDPHCQFQLMRSDVLRQQPKLAQVLTAGERGAAIAQSGLRFTQVAVQHQSQPRARRHRSPKRPAWQAVLAQVARHPVASRLVLGGLAAVVTLAFITSLLFTRPPEVQADVAVIPGDDWPTYLQSPQRGAANGDSLLAPTTAGNLVKLWATPTGGGIAASASVVKTTAYIGSWDGYEYTLDTLTGVVKWKTFLGQTSVKPCTPQTIGITSSATVAGDAVYVGGGDAYWYALDARTGAVLWRIFTGDNADRTGGHYNWSSPLIIGDFAYIGIASNCDSPLVQGQLLKVDLTTHKVAQVFNVVPDGQVGGGIWTSPAWDAHTNTIYVTTGTQNLASQVLAQSILAIDANTLTLKDYWHLPSAEAGTDSDWGNTPTLMTDRQGRTLVAATNKNGFTYAFDAAHLSAGPIWQVQIARGGECPPCGEGSVSSGAFAQGKLFIAGGNTTISGAGYLGSVRALDPATGAVLWTHGTLAPVIPALAYSNGVVIDGAGTTLEVLDAATGERLYGYAVNIGIDAPPSVAHGQIFIGALDGQVYSFGLAGRLQVPSTPDCPSHWTCQDLGQALPAGQESGGGNHWQVSGGGAGIGSYTDQFHFMYEAAQGDFRFTARLHSVGQPPPGAQMGLMVRQSATPEATSYAVLYEAGKGYFVQYRLGLKASTIVSGSLASSTGPNATVLIQRHGDTFQAAISQDGQHFTLIPGSTVAMALPATVRVGLAVSSNASDALATADFSQIALTGTIQPNLVGPLPLDPCPARWNCQDSGNPAMVGDQALAPDGTWTVTGAGSDIWTNQDQFHFVAQSLSGDATLTARMARQRATDANAKAGVMLRASAAADAPYYAAFLTPGNGLVVQYRATAGLLSYTIVDSDPATAAAHQQTRAALKPPLWLRVTRWNNIFTTYISTDGRAWQPVPDSSQILTMPDTLLAALAVTSHNTKVLGQATFDHVTIISSAPTAPIACPLAWDCGDIGYAAPPGSQIVSGPTWTLTAGGYEIDHSYDAFHYVWQEVAGNATVSAQVLSEHYKEGVAFTKGGVMIRQNNDPSAPYYGIFVMPHQGIVVQYRRAFGGLTGAMHLDGHLGMFVKATCQWGTCVAYTSNDGSIWQQVPYSAMQVPLTNAVLAGIAATSDDNGSLATITFADVIVR